MVQVRRVAYSIFAGALAEIANKIFPLIIIHYAQEKLGINQFGYAQFGIYLIDLFIPFVVWGYNTLGSIMVGENRTQPERVRAAIGQIITLRLLNAALAFGMVMGAVLFIPSYNQYTLIALSLSFLLFSSAIDTSYVLIGIQKVFIFSLLSVVMKTLSLVLVLVFVKNPGDAILYATLSFGINAVVSLGTVIYTIRKFGMIFPQLAGVKELFVKSVPFGISYFLFYFSDRIDLFVVEHMFGTTGVGLYAGALRLQQAIIPIVYTIGWIFFGEMVALSRQDEREKYLRFGFWAILCVTAPIVAGIWFVGGDILVLMFSPEYRSIEAILAILVFTTLLHGIFLIFGNNVLVLNNRIWVLNSCLGFGVFLSGIFCYMFGKSYGMLGTACGTILAKMIAALLVVYFARPFIEAFPWKELIKIAIPTAIMVLALSVLHKNGLMVNLAVGGTSYGLGIIIFNYTELRLALSKIRHTDH